MGHPLEKLYPFLPVSLQNLGISLYGLFWKNERLGGDFERHVEEFRARDRCPVQQMHRYVEQELRRVLCRAYDEVPYYRQTWGQKGIGRARLEKMTVEDLHTLPPTPKQDLRADPDSFLAQDVSKKKLQRYFSSGSTGTPITAICSAEDHRRFIAAREVRSFGWARSTIRSSRAMIGGRLVVPRGLAKPPFYRYNRAERQVYFSAYHISPTHMANYVEGFDRHRPRLLTGYANSYFLLARMMRQEGTGLDYEPDAIVLCSEKLTPEMKRVIQQAFRARAYEEYGAVENCVLATECECGSLHVSPDFGILEIIKDDGTPAAPGEEGRILCTGLLNETQPLIRYDIGDIGVWSDEPCACGRNHLPVLKEIVGRLEDVVVGPDGREMVRFHGIFIDLPNVLEGQVIQESLDEFTLKIVPQGNFGIETERLIHRRFIERLGPVKVNIERVSEIPRTARGKFRAVISKVSPGRAASVANAEEASV